MKCKRCLALLVLLVFINPSFFELDLEMDEVFLFNYLLETEGDVKLFRASDGLIVVIEVWQLGQNDAVILLLD